MEQRIFKQILKCLPDTPKYKKHIIAIALNIYLVWCGIRPGCIPFDEILLEPNTPECDKVIKSLNKISDIKAVIGPYYDVGISLVIYNTKSNMEPILTKIAQLRENKEKLISKLTENFKITYNTTNIKEPQEQLFSIINNDEDTIKINSQIHPLMGKLLGYQCELNLSAPMFYEQKLYSINYIIPKLNYHFGFWCPLSAKKEMLQCVTKLESMHTVFAKLSMPVLNELELTISIFEP